MLSMLNINESTCAGFQLLKSENVLLFFGGGMSMVKGSVHVFTDIVSRLQLFKNVKVIISRTLIFHSC